MVCIIQNLVNLYATFALDFVLFTPYRKKRKGKDEKKKKRRKRRRKLEKPKIITICLMHITSISRLI